MSEIPQTPARPVLPNEIDQKLSLREFEQRMEALRIWVGSQFTHIREVTDIRAEALETALKLQAVSAEKALELQADEYARRLEELNHAHKTAMENWARSLPRELFDSVQTDWNKWRDVTNNSVLVLQQESKDIAGLGTRVNKLESESQNLNGAMTLIRYMGLAGVVALAISLLRLAGAIQ